MFLKGSYAAIQYPKDKIEFIGVFCVCVCPQLCFVYWDMSCCLRTLTEILEEGRSFVADDIQVSRTLFATPPFLLIYRFYFHTSYQSSKSIQTSMEMLLRGYFIAGFQ